MDLDDLLHELHFAPHKNNPPDWAVNWDDAPLPFKLYRGLPTIELSHEVPFILAKRDTKHAQPSLSDVGHFLWYTYGLSQVSHFIDAERWPEAGTNVLTTHRRFVPSGGGLYPSELYMYLKIPELPCGVYHYDVAHHRLVLLRAGNVDAYLDAAVRHDRDLSTCFATVLVSTMFWKNFFKYHNFSYRLQGLDAGALIGQLRVVAERFRFAVEVCFQFLDRAVNQLLGLNDHAESTYAVIPLWSESVNAPIAPTVPRSGTESAIELCRSMPEIQTEYHIGSRGVKDFPLLVQLNEASFIETTASLKPSTEHEMPTRSDADSVVPLPDVPRLSHDLLSVCQSRHSPGMNFVHSHINQQELASLLYETTTAALHESDRGGERTEHEAWVSIYLSLYGIDGIPDGAYQYQRDRHQLRLIRSGDQRATLQSGMNLHTVSMFHVPICVHLAGDRQHNKDAFGYRGHRIQHMQAGIILQYLLLSACALGMNGHPLLDFDASTCDAIYALDARGETTLVQVPMGHYRFGNRFTGGLHG